MGFQYLLTDGAAGRQVHQGLTWPFTLSLHRRAQGLSVQMQQSSKHLHPVSQETFSGILAVGDSETLLNYSQSFIIRNPE